MFPVRWWWSTSELQLQYGNCNSAILQSILHVFHLVLLFFPVFYMKNFHQTSVKLTLAPSKGVRTYPLHCLSLWFMVFMELPVVLSTLKPLKISSSWDFCLLLLACTFVVHLRRSVCGFEFLGVLPKQSLLRVMKSPVENVSNLW